MSSLDFKQGSEIENILTHKKRLWNGVCCHDFFFCQQYLIINIIKKTFKIEKLLNKRFYAESFSCKFNFDKWFYRQMQKNKFQNSS